MLLDHHTKYQILSGAVKIYTSLKLVDTTYEKVQLSWLERIKSMRPWIKYKTITKHTPSTEIVIIGDDLWCHPALLPELKREVEKFSVG